MAAIWRTSLRAVAAVAISILAAGCSGGSSGGDGGGDGTPKKGGTLTMAIQTESQSMDPAKCGTVGWDRCVPVFGTLLRYNPETKKFEGDMAKSFDSTDGKVWTLTLRDGVKFSDGTAFDADAVVTNWDRIKDPATLSPSAATITGLTWKAIDPLTVEVTSDAVNYQLPRNLTLGLSMIGSPTAIEKAGVGFGNAPVGAGPFVLEKWTRNAQAEYKRNDTYWDTGLPYADKFVLKVIGQDAQRLNALRAGEIDIDWSVVQKDATKIEAEGFTAHKVPLIGGSGLIFNFDDPMVKDASLREALLSAIDAKQITDAVYQGDTVVDAFIFKDSPYRDDALGTYPVKDLAKAQRLFDDYLASTGASSLKLTFSTYAGVPALEQASQILQSQLQKIKGLTIDIKALDSATISGNFRTGDYQIALQGASMELPDQLYDFFHSDGSANVTGYSNPTVDEALETARTSNDEATVTKAYQVVGGELSKDAPLRSWRYTSGYLYAPKSIKGLRITGSGDAVGAYLERTWVDK